MTDLSEQDLDDIAERVRTKLPGIVRDVRTERAYLATIDPAGEADAVAPLSPVQAREILLDIEAEKAARKPFIVVRGSGSDFDEKAILVAIGADLTKRAGRVACPAHEDRHPSLSWKIADSGRVLLKCWVGCTFDEIRRAAA
jgi:hypothetical protein